MPVRPSTPPAWATNTDFQAGANPWNGQPNKVAPASGVIAEGFTPQAGMPAEYINSLFNNYGNWLQYLDQTISSNEVPFVFAGVSGSNLPANQFNTLAAAVSYAQSLAVANPPMVIIVGPSTETATPISITKAGLTIYNANKANVTTWNSQTALFDLAGNTNLTFDGMNMSCGATHPGTVKNIAFLNSAGLPGSLLIKNCTFAGTGAQSFYYDATGGGLYHASFENNNSYASESFIWLDTASSICEFVSITNNTHATNAFLLAATDIIHLYPSIAGGSTFISNNVLNNLAAGNPGNCISINGNMSGVISSNNSLLIISSSSSTNVNIENNVVGGVASAGGSVVITGNTITSSYGILGAIGSGWVVSSNLLTATGTKISITGDYANVTSNIIKAAQGYITVAGDFAVVTGNTMDVSTATGTNVLTVDGSYYTITGNVVTGSNTSNYSMIASGSVSQHGLISGNRCFNLIGCSSVSSILIGNSSGTTSVAGGIDNPSNPGVAPSNVVVIANVVGLGGTVWGAAPPNPSGNTADHNEAH